MHSANRNLGSNYDKNIILSPFCQNILSKPQFLNFRLMPHLVVGVTNAIRLICFGKSLNKINMDVQKTNKSRTDSNDADKDGIPHLLRWSFNIYFFSSSNSAWVAFGLH